ncbi:MAG TPA: hypothetical protein VFL36_13790 [Myxococcales bacterium]|nr:hypothetical protein [Myxococcales bacterium]
MKLVAALSFVMLAIGAATLVYWRSQPEAQPCDTREIAQSRSPDGRAQADVFELRCGASVATHVALRAASAPLRARSDVFVAAGSAPVQATWNDSRELVVQSPGARVLVQETSWRDVTIRLR